MQLFSSMAVFAANVDCLTSKQHKQLKVLKLQTSASATTHQQHGNMRKAAFLVTLGLPTGRNMSTAAQQFLLGSKLPQGCLVHQNFRPVQLIHNGG